MRKEREISRTIVAVIFSTVLVLWVLTPVVINQFYLDIAHRGQFGDLFGSINALFSGLAFAGVIVAILLQREELKLQREELAANRAELQRAATAQEKSREALRKTIYAQAYMNAVAILQADEVRTARRYVFTHLRKAPMPWVDSQIRDAEIVCHTYANVGNMVRQQMLPLEYLAAWAEPAKKAWEVLEPLVQKYRIERPGENTWVDFEFLVDQLETLSKQ